jgi:uncharacterized pyridoxamine 5'-phosphate oxidase family protein
MDLKDCLRFANESPVSYVTTKDGDQPRVRALLIWFADESGFYYHTRALKSVCQQLKRNPNVEFLDDPAPKDRLLEERPFFKALVKGPDDPRLAVFRIPH